jgi:NADH-quinone oxidoreductase subunit E
MKPEWNQWAREFKEQYPGANSALMPLLHRIQAEEGWLSDETIHDVATLFDLPESYVESVASFYSLFFRNQVGKKVVHVCVGLSCALAGSDRLMENLEHRLGIKEGQTTADGEYTLLEAECLAACNQAPVAQVNLRYFEGLDPERPDVLLESSKSPEEEVKP